MKTKTALLTLGWFAGAAVASISCGGSSGSGDNATGGSGGGTAGVTSTAGTSSAGTTATGGTANSGGSNATAGTANNQGGTAANEGGAPDNRGGTRNDNQGGARDLPGAGGAFTIPGCPPTQPSDDAACTREGVNRFGCPYDDGAIVCTCDGAGQMRAWSCEAPNLGQGGDNGGFGQATCPADAQPGDDCTGGPGLCADQPCICGQDDTIVICF